MSFLFSLDKYTLVTFLLEWVNNLKQLNALDTALNQSFRIRLIDLMKEFPGKFVDVWKWNYFPGNVNLFNWLRVRGNQDLQIKLVNLASVQELELFRHNVVAMTVSQEVIESHGIELLRMFPRLSKFYSNLPELSCPEFRSALIHYMIVHCPKMEVYLWSIFDNWH